MLYLVKTYYGHLSKILRTFYELKLIFYEILLTFNGILHIAWGKFFCHLSTILRFSYEILFEGLQFYYAHLKEFYIFRMKFYTSSVHPTKVNDTFRMKFYTFLIHFMKENSCYMKFYALPKRKENFTIFVENSL